jgi:hypothetical protein
MMTSAGYYAQDPSSYEQLLLHEYTIPRPYWQHDPPSTAALPPSPPPPKRSGYVIMVDPSDTISYDSYWSYDSYLSSETEDALCGLLALNKTLTLNKK